jgi:hypothetical protein
VKSHYDYARYVARHKFYVFVAGLHVRAPLWRLLVHDWSKFTKAEWNAYVQTFFGNKDEDRTKFQRAWLHHIHRNPHHWNHHFLTQQDGRRVVFEMPEKLIREMVADWAGAGRAQLGRWEVGMWYWQNREKMILHEKTRARVEDLVDQFTLGMRREMRMKKPTPLLDLKLLFKVVKLWIKE